MKQLGSIVIDCINEKLAWFQDKSQEIVENSFILKNLDNLIFVFISLVLIGSLFMGSEQIGLIALVVTALTVLKLFLHKGQTITLASCNLFLLIFLGFNIISVINSTEFVYSVMGITKTFIYLSFYFSVIQFLRYNREKIVPLFYLIASLACFEGVVGIIQNNMDLSNISTWQDTSYINPEDVVSRIYGTLLPYNPNLLGGYLVAAISSILAVMFLSVESKKMKQFVIASVGFLITSLTLFFTGCRGAYLALFSIVLGFIYASWIVIKENEKLKKYWQIAVSTIIGSGLIVMVSIPSILKRIMSILVMREDSSTSFRMNVYNSSLNMFTDNWLLGIGVGNKTFREVYGLYMISGFDALSSYCVFLEMAVESGIFALLAYLIFLYLLISNSIKAFLSNTDLKFRILIFSAAISVIAVMVHGFFDTIYFRPQVQFVYWIMVSILVVLLQEKEITE